MYVESIRGLAEFDEGPESGWMFRVNGVFPETAASNHTLRNGDRLEWLYSRDFGRDLGAAEDLDDDPESAEDPDTEIDDDEEETDEVTEVEPDRTILELPPPLIIDVPHTVRDIFPYIEFVNEWNNPFRDIGENDWFYRYIRFAFANGLILGMSEDEFAPNTSLSRAMIVTILWRLSDSPKAAGNNSFADVRQGQWYTTAINWAYEEGVVSGYGNGQFGPSDNITREQLSLILLNYARYHGLNANIDTFSTMFSDSGDVSPWASSAMMWANTSGIVAGRSATTLVPGGTATRAEAAAMMLRFIEYARESDRSAADQ